jgi:tetratricopeptide (TPR) repeat protein
MMPEPFSFQLPIEDFDLSLLPVDAALLRSDASLLASAIREFYQEAFRRLGGSATVVVRDAVVSVAWQPASGDAAAQLLEHAIGLLKHGKTATAEPILRALVARDSENADALYNLGMMLSDQGRLDEAIETLQRHLEFLPGHSNGWAALGVAQARRGAASDAIESLERALEIDPQNAHALRNLAAIRAKESPVMALPLMQEAARLLPHDQRAQYGLAQCMLQLDRIDEADPLLVKTISLDPLSDIAELARTDRSRIAQASFRAKGSDGARPDAVFYCLDALRCFHALGESQTKTITFEIAMLGRGGFDINDAEKKYSLKSLSGKFSGLQLVSMMYVGMKAVAPAADVGIDLSKEYNQAKVMLELEK